MLYFDYNYIFGELVGEDVYTNDATQNSSVRDSRPQQTMDEKSTEKEKSESDLYQRLLADATEVKERYTLAQTQISRLQDELQRKDEELSKYRATTTTIRENTDTAQTGKILELSQNEEKKVGQPLKKTEQPTERQTKDVKRCEDEAMKAKEECETSQTKKELKKDQQDEQKNRGDNVAIPGQLVSKTKEELIGLNRDLEERLQQQQVKNDALFMRFSELSCNNMVSGNSNVVELSQNRPEKIAERFTNVLYNDRFVTAVFELIEEPITMADSEAADLLTDILKYVYHMCLSILQDQKRKLGSNVRAIHMNVRWPAPPIGINEYPLIPHTIPFPSFVQLNGPLCERLATTITQDWMNPTQDTFDNLYKYVLDGLQHERATNIQSETMKSYVMESVQVVWLLLTRDPPLVLEFCSTPSRAECELFTFREKSTPNSNDYRLKVVWPALCQQDGVVILRGEAQRIPSGQHAQGDQDANANDIRHNKKKSKGKVSGGRQEKPPLRGDVIQRVEARKDRERRVKDKQQKMAVAAEEMSYKVMDERERLSLSTRATSRGTSCTSSSTLGARKHVQFSDVNQRERATIAYNPTQDNKEIGNRNSVIPNGTKLSSNVVINTRTEANGDVKFEGKLSKEDTMEARVVPSINVNRTSEPKSSTFNEKLPPFENSSSRKTVAVT